MGKQTTITIETESLLVLRGQSSLRAWCPQCASERDVIPISSAGVISNLSPGAVEAWLESEAIHRMQAAEGTQLICLTSLIQRTQKPKTT